MPPETAKPTEAPKPRTRKVVHPAVQAEKDATDALGFCIGKLGTLPPESASRIVVKLNEIFGSK